MSLDYDLGELLVFQESTSNLLYPTRGTHRFGRFPPPPNRWPRGANTPSSTGRSSGRGTTTRGGAGLSPTTWDHPSGSAPNTNSSNAATGAGGVGHFPHPQHISNSPATPTHLGDPGSAASAANPGGAGGNGGGGAAGSSFVGEDDKQNDVHWTLVSEGAFTVMPENVPTGSTPRLGPVSAAGFGDQQQQHPQAQLQQQQNLSASVASKFSPSVLVSLTAVQQAQLVAQQEQQNTMNAAIREAQQQQQQATAGGKGAASTPNTSGAAPKKPPSPFEAAYAPSILTVADKTLLVLSVGCPQHKVDVAVVLWYSNLEKGVRPGFWFAQTAYLIEFLKHAAHELGFLPVSPLSALVTSSSSSAAAAAMAAGGGSNNNTTTTTTTATTASSAAMQLAVASAAMTLLDFERPPEVFHAARSALRERVRQLRLAFVPNINQRSITQNTIATLFYPITLPRSVGKTDREMTLAVQDESVRYSWEAARHLMFLCNPADPAVMNFACSAVGYALALSRNSPLYGSKSAQSSGGVIFPELFNFSLPPSSSSTGAAAAAVSPSPSPANPQQSRTPTKNNENSSAANESTKQQPPQTLSELLALALRHDLDHSDCSAQQKSLVKIEQLVQAIQFFHEHPGRARIVLLSKRDGATNQEDHTAACIFDVLRAIFRPAGRFAHSRDSGLFARKVSEKDGAKPGQLWGTACFWTPLTHVEFSPSFDPSAVVMMSQAVGAGGGRRNYRAGHVPSSAAAASSSSSSSSASMVIEEAFFVPKLQSALEFSHTLLVVDCMHKQIFLAAPAPQQQQQQQQPQRSPVASGAPMTLPPPVLARGSGNNNGRPVSPLDLNNATSTSPSTAENPQQQQRQQQQQNNNTPKHHNHVISALPCALTFVEECRSMWEAAHLQSAAAAAASQSAANSSAAAVNSAANLIGVDVLRAITDLSPILRSMAEAELAQLLMRQGAAADGDDATSASVGDNNNKSLLLATPPKNQQHDQSHLFYGGGQPVMSVNDFSPSSRFSPMRTRSNLSTVNFVASAGGGGAGAGGGPYGASPPGPSVVATTAAAAAAGSGAGGAGAIDSAPVHHQQGGHHPSARPGMMSSVQSSTLSGAYQPVQSGATAGVKGAIKAHQQQPHFQPTLMNSFLSNDALFALLV